MPKPTPPIPKADARKLVLERRKELSTGENLDKSKRIFERLIELDTSRQMIKLYSLNFIDDL